jgi:hypothetical protein
MRPSRRDVNLRDAQLPNVHSKWTEIACRVTSGLPVFLLIAGCDCDWAGNFGPLLAGETVRLIRTDGESVKEFADVKKVNFDPGLVARWFR